MTSKSSARTRESGFGRFKLDNRRSIASRSCFASVVYFHYKNQNLLNAFTTNRDRNDPNADEMAVETGIIETEISSLRVAKSLTSSSTFQLTLLPSKNWKQVLSPGDWLMIYIHDNSSLNKGDESIQDTKNLIMLGNVDRVSRSLQKDKETDKTTLRYVVSGRGIQKVFENTDIWWNPYLATDKEMDVILRDAGLEILGNPSILTNNLLEVFLGSGGEFDGGKTSDMGMWLIPPSLERAMRAPVTFSARFDSNPNPGVSTDSVPDSARFDGVATAEFPRFYDILDIQIENHLPGFKQRMMLTANSNGSLLELLQRSSNSLVNELYFEEVRDSSGYVRPTIVLTPRPVQTPFFESKSDGLKGHYKSLQELGETNFVEILQSEILYEDLGRDDHSRFNLWWMNTDSNMEGVTNAQADRNKTTGAINPILSSKSIHRHGLRRWTHLMEFCHASGVGSSTQSDLVLFQGFMEQLYDMNAFNHLYDSGTIECTGILEAELGKALIVKADTAMESPDKIYYIEGYEHSWSFPSTWRTTFTLTHGQWFTTGINIFIDAGRSDYGKLDDALSSTYVAQTFTSKS